MEIFKYDEFDPTKQNAIIQASAGTGKTFSVQEIVKKLVFNDCYNKALDFEKEKKANDNLKQVLIVTFTEKATGELKDRIRIELEAELEKRKENGIDSKDLSINFDVNSFNIFTIHSFCQNSIKEFCVDANLPIGLSVITNEKYYLNSFIDKYIREGNIFLEINDLINQDVEINIDNLKNRFVDVLSKYSNDKSIISLKYLDVKGFNDYYNSDPLFKKHSDNLKNSSDEFGKAYYHYLVTIDDFTSLIKTLTFNKNYRFEDSNLDNLYLYFLSVRDKAIRDTGFNGTTFKDMLDFDKANSNDLNYKYNALLKSCDFRAVILAKIIEDESANSKLKFRMTKNDILSLTFLSQNEKDAIEYITNISSNTINKKEKPEQYLVVKYIQELYELWQDEKIKNKQQSFNDMIQSVRERLSSNPKFKKALQDKYNFAIIDEFQDTNQLQFDIFKSIFMEDDKHRIIVVGDPKQSIYQFQGADLNVYEEAKNNITDTKNIVNGEIYELDTNWRSTEKIVNSCNFFFKDDYFYRNIDNAPIKISFSPSKYSKCGKEAYYLGNPVNAAFWVGGRKNPDNNNFEKINPDIYAEQVVKQIIDFCSYVNNTKITKLQIRPKDEKDKDGKPVKQPLRNVTFSDFTILYRVRSEAEYIERVLKKCGIPFIKFKDKKLFSSKECAHFIAILEAIDAIDFTGNNRNIFKKALFTDFFNKSLSEIADEKYNRDDNDEMELIFSWKELAKKKKWENLIDHIIDDSKITERLCTTEKIQSLTIYKQLADYIISYLYDNNTISDLINNLKSSAKGSTEDDDEGTIEVGVDLNSVKLMTIHASKGLQFPVVCSIAGFKDKITKSMSYIYHDNKMRKISFESGDSNTDDYLEFKRLIYVDYTRAEYLMMIPYYIYNKEKSFGGILSKDTEEYIKTSKTYNVFKEMYCDEIVDYKEYNDLKKQVDSILKETNIIKTEEKEKSDKANNIVHKKKDEQEEILSHLRGISFNKRSHLYAYSNLAHNDDKEDENAPIDDGTSVYKDDEEREEPNTTINTTKTINFDDKYKPMKDANYVKKEPNPIPSKFPKGKEIGSVLHKIFEKSNFTDYKSRGVNDSKLELIIKNAFNEFKLKAPEPGSDNMKYIVEMVYSVLNSNLNVIKGNEIFNEKFKLSSISKKDKKEEVDFNFNIFKNRQLLEYFNGSIDLVFRKKYGEQEYYSILDWKSDSLNETDLKSYYEFDYLDKHTKKNYEIQRVIYSYCLVKWLNKQYKKEETLEETFKNHFGGVYYIYIRGCSEDTRNGIYCQTWDCFKDLEEAYKKIVSTLIISDESNRIKLGGLKDDDIL